MEGDTATPSGQLNKPDTYRPASLLELLSFKLSGPKQSYLQKSITAALLEDRDEV